LFFHDFSGYNRAAEFSTTAVTNYLPQPRTVISIVWKHVIELLADGRKYDIDHGGLKTVFIGSWRARTWASQSVQALFGSTISISEYKVGSWTYPDLVVTVTATLSP